MIAPENEAQPWVIDLDTIIPGIAVSLGVPENPVDRNAQATLYDDDGNASGMQSFSFDTSQVRTFNSR